MKIIDLLNKIANGEIPKKIKYDNRFYTFNEKEDNYYEDEYCSINWDYVSLHCLNDEVEILEEEKKIPEKLHHCYTDTDNEDIEFLIKNINDFVDRYNELLDFLKSKGDE